MTSIDKYLHEFEAYFNGDLNAEEKRAFEEALSHNSEMDAAWKEYRSMMDAFSKKEAISLRLSLNKIFYSQQHDRKVLGLTNNLWLRLSVAAVIIVIMGCLLYFFCSSRDPFQSVNGIQYTKTVDSLGATQPGRSHDNILLDNDSVTGTKIQNQPTPIQIASIYDSKEYQISPVFAELLHNVYRGNWFILTSPEDSTIFRSGDSIVFKWETDIQEPMYFDLLDRHGNVVFRKKFAVESPWIFKPSLTPSIYMFRFSTEDQPVWMGVMVGV